MKPWHKRIIAAAVIVIPLTIFLLWPLASDRWSLRPDADLLRRKEDYLRGLRETMVTSVRRSNIVIILADDLGRADCGIYGGSGVPTPHIDAIGREGCTFTDAYCAAPICSPSRASLFTGRYPQRSGFEYQQANRYPRNRAEYWGFKYLVPMGDWFVADTDTVPREEDRREQGLSTAEITLSEMLDAAGYRTGAFGKWHLGGSRGKTPADRAFREFYGFHEAFTLYAPVDDPSIVASHHDYYADRYTWSRGREGSCAIRRGNTPVDERGYLTARIADEAVSFIEKNRDRPFFLYVPFNAPHTPFQAPREYYDRYAHVADHNLRVYYAMIAALDDAVGRIDEAIRRSGRERDTIVVFASDNGIARYTGVGEHDPLRGGKFSFFEGGVRVPMLARWPGRIPRGISHNGLVSLMDLFPTAARAAGVPLPDDRPLDGRDLLPQIMGTGTARHEALFWRAGYARAVRRGDWKFIEIRKNGAAALYDLARDPGERHNLAAANSSLVAELRRAMDEWEKQVSPPAWPNVIDYRFMIDGVPFYFPL